MSQDTFSKSCWRHSETAKKLTGKALAEFEARRDVWKEVLEGVREIKTGDGKLAKGQPTSQVVRVRLKSGLSQAEFAAASTPSRAETSAGANCPIASLRLLSGIFLTSVVGGLRRRGKWFWMTNHWST